MPKEKCKTPSPHIKSEKLKTEINTGGKIKRNEEDNRIRKTKGILIGGAVGLLIGKIISFDVILAIETGMFLGLVTAAKLKKK
ncbi:MAG: hypothetical protein LBR09_01810 [Endomicrobium sp.]|jgi:hypothetical protein|nr:hypothetical protein [Endomicrobium sp.]